MHIDAGNQFIFTSRIVGYKEVRITGKKIKEVTILNFEENEIKQFIEHWTELIENISYEDNIIAKNSAKKIKEELLYAINRNKGVRDLASNPLLLTILCLMKKKGVPLPERRVQLYDKYVEILLDYWNQVRNIEDITPERTVNVNELINILAPLAFGCIITVKELV